MFEIEDFTDDTQYSLKLNSQLCDWTKVWNRTVAHHINNREAGIAS